LQPEFHPKELISKLAESLLAHYAEKPLIDAYDIYQHLMDYWVEIMQDDCYMIAADGWKAETTRIIVTDKRGKHKDKGWICDLIPKTLIVACYYPKEQAAIDELAAELESTTAQLAELEVEHSGDDGALAGLDINKASIAARLNEIKRDKEAKEDAAVLTAWLRLNADATDLKRRLKDREAALDAKTYSHYPKLTNAEIKALVVDDKWLGALDGAIHGEMDRVSQQLTQRVKQLAERYETTLPQIQDHVLKLEARVTGHLERMGFSWK
jgi:type I restriction enzyme M protein